MGGDDPAGEIEGDVTIDLGDDGTGIGIPLCHLGAALDRIALVDMEACTIRHFLHRKLLAALVNDDELHVASHDRQTTLAVLHDCTVSHLHRAVEV